MIPLRVSVKNFLCYHDQVFEFEGHPVWLLHGPNGVGKSTVFDAILYALFGEHKRREGAGSKVEDLVRHGETSARVDFEFEYLSTRYHIWRVRPRKGQPKQGVSRFEDNAPVPLRDYNNAADVNKWVRDLIGMDVEAFTSAALLRQGAAERLLDSDIADRIELYRGIIDVAPYQKLEESVRDARGEANAHVRILTGSLKSLREVPEAEVTAATGARDEAIAAWEQCRANEKRMQECLEASRVWDELSGRARELRAALDGASARAARVEELEAAVRRLHELRAVIPALQRFDDATKAWNEKRERLANVTQERTEAERTCESLRVSVANEKWKADAARDRSAELDREIASLDERLRELAKQIEQSDRAAELHRKLAEARKKSFDSDLDAQFERAAEAVVESTEAKSTLPTFEAVIGQRTAFHTAVGVERAAREAHASAMAEHGRLQTELDAAEAERKRLQEESQAAGTTAAVAKRRHEDALAALERLDSLDGQAACSLCRQPLGPDCIEHARDGLKEDIREAKAESKKRQDAAKAAADAAKESESRLRNLVKLHQAAEKARTESSTHVQLAEQRVLAARTAFASAVAALSPVLIQRIGAIKAEEYPQHSDVEHLREAARQAAARTARLEELRALRTERDHAESVIANLKDAVKAVGAPPDVSQARAEVSVGESRRGDLQTERDAVQTSRTDATAARSRFETQLHLAEQSRTQIEVRFGAAEADARAAERERESASDLLPADACELDRAALQAELDRLERADVERDFAAVAEDRTLKSDREARLAQIEVEIEARVPPAARRPSAEVATALRQAGDATQDAERNRDEKRQDVERLAAERARRIETETRLAAASHSHGLHDRLAGLLGAEGIQNALVQQAEVRIIGFANETLHRVSDGNLHLEPAEPGANRIAVRYRGQPIPADNLSSGQRCRAAVSLALAVCRFAGDEARPLQSVIIDEAFANLDREGRMAMVNAIHDETTAGGRLERILVVSHHEDVAAAFPVGYRLSNDGVRTIATRTPE